MKEESSSIRVITRFLVILLTLSLSQAYTESNVMELQEATQEAEKADLVPSFREKSESKPRQDSSCSLERKDTPLWGKVHTMVAVARTSPSLQKVRARVAAVKQTLDSKIKQTKAGFSQG